MEIRYEALVRHAMAQAEVAVARGDPPFGAVLAAPDGTIILAAANEQLSSGDPTAHAELVLVREASRRLGLASLEGLVVASNAESCSMCASALVKAGVAEIVYGAPHEPHMDPLLPLDVVVAASRHRPRITHVASLKDACRRQVRDARRDVPPPD